MISKHAVWADRMWIGGILERLKRRWLSPPAGVPLAYWRSITWFRHGVILGAGLCICVMIHYFVTGLVSKVPVLFFGLYWPVYWITSRRLLSKMRKRVRDLDLMMCPECGYCVRELGDSYRCSECGTQGTIEGTRAVWSNWLGE